MIDRSGPYNSVFLVQSRLGDPASQAMRRQARELLAEGADRILVFFHAAAAALDDDRERIGWAELASSIDVSLVVCQAARARRVSGALEKPFELSSLVRLWDAVLRARDLYAPGRCPVRRGGFVIRIARRVDEADAREFLELVLAGASLELDLLVLFEGEGLTTLAGERARPWRQLIDHRLARMVTTSAERESALLETVDAAVVADWRATRSWIEP